MNGLNKSASFLTMVEQLRNLSLTIYNIYDTVISLSLSLSLLFLSFSLSLIVCADVVDGEDEVD